MPISFFARLGSRMKNAVFDQGADERALKQLAKDDPPTDLVLAVLEALQSRFDRLDKYLVGAKANPKVLLSHQVAQLAQTTQRFLKNLRVSLGHPEAWKALMATRAKVDLFAGQVLDPPAAMEAGLATEGGGGATAWWRPVGFAVWMMLLSLMIGFLWVKGGCPLDWGTVSPLEPVTDHVDWWVEEDDWDFPHWNPAQLDAAVADEMPEEGIYKHRRNLLDSSFTGPVFGEGISMHASQETRLSEYMIGLMIVDAFCVWLLVLYPPLKSYRRRIVGGGL